MPKVKKSQRAEQVESEDFVPLLGQKRAKQRPPPRVESSPPFLFTHHPEGWTVMQGTVVPRLGKFKLLPGINGVEENPKTGELIPGAALAEVVERGVTVVPYDVDGPGTTYLRRPAGRPDVHISRFERVYPGSTKIDCDEVAYVEWCRSLMDRGVVASPPVYVLERMEAELVRQVEDLEERRGSESLRRRLMRDLNGVREEIEVRRVGEPTEVEAPDDPVKPPVGGAA